MDYRLDQKGKYYTTRVSKRTAEVQVLAGSTLISGTMYLLGGNRVKDELNSGERFIALTHARVCAPDSDEILAESDTLILNKDRIVWIIPCEEADSDIRSAQSIVEENDIPGN